MEERRVRTGEAFMLLNALVPARGAAWVSDGY